MLLANKFFSKNGDSVTIKIEGCIGILGEKSEGISTLEELKEMWGSFKSYNPKVLRVEIRSIGGDITEALSMYEFLKNLSLDVKVFTICYGYVASSATVIAQAASDKCRIISYNALYLIHNSIMSAEGDENEMKRVSEVLKKTDIRIQEIYSNSSGKSPRLFWSLMKENGGHGKWLSPSEVKDLKLVDNII